jgi:hypothetical protein
LLGKSSVDKEDEKEIDPGTLISVTNPDGTIDLKEKDDGKGINSGLQV